MVRLVDCYKNTRVYLKRLFKCPGDEEEHRTGIYKWEKVLEVNARHVLKLKICAGDPEEVNRSPFASDQNASHLAGCVSPTKQYSPSHLFIPFLSCSFGWTPLEAYWGDERPTMFKAPLFHVYTLLSFATKQDHKHNVFNPLTKWLVSLLLGAFFLFIAYWWKELKNPLFWLDKSSLKINQSEYQKVVLKFIYNRGRK